MTSIETFSSLVVEQSAVNRLAVGSNTKFKPQILHKKIFEMQAFNIFSFVSDYLNNQFETINSNIHDVAHIGYTYFLLAIVIKVIRKIKKNG